MTTNRDYPEIISAEQLAALKARAELVPELVIVATELRDWCKENGAEDLRLNALLARAKEVMDA